MLISVRQLQIRKLTFDVRLKPGTIDLSRTKFRQTNEVRVAGVAELRGGVQEIRVAGRIAATLVGDCDRCLEETPLELDREFDLTYRPASMDNESAVTELDAEESEIGYYEGEGLRLADVVNEQILLWLPMHWFCSEDCNGICPSCGVNRNKEACNCQAQQVDERWAALKGFRPSSEN